MLEHVAVEIGDVARASEVVRVVVVLVLLEDLGAVASVAIPVPVIPANTVAIALPAVAVNPALRNVVTDRNGHPCQLNISIENSSIEIVALAGGTSVEGKLMISILVAPSSTN